MPRTGSCANRASIWWRLPPSATSASAARTWNAPPCGGRLATNAWAGAAFSTTSGITRTACICAAGAGSTSNAWLRARAKATRCSAWSRRTPRPCAGALNKCGRPATSAFARRRRARNWTWTPLWRRARTSAWASRRTSASTAAASACAATWRRLFWWTCPLPPTTPWRTTNRPRKRPIRTSATPISTMGTTSPPAWRRTPPNAASSTSNAKRRCSWRWRSKGLATATPCTAFPATDASAWSSRWPRSSTSPCAAALRTPSPP